MNIALIFALALPRRLALSGFGSVVGASQGGVVTGQDGHWLLTPRGRERPAWMGSLLGAAAGRCSTRSTQLLRGVPPGDEQQLLYAVLDRPTFALIALVLAFRPKDCSGGGMRSYALGPKTVGSGRSGRSRRLAACGPSSSTITGSSALLTQTFIFGIVAARPDFLTAYGG